MSELTEDLFPPELVERLETLQLAVRSRVLGRHEGERASRRRGPGLEFADYRAYAPGDEVRRVDWHAYARTDRLFVKLFTEEREATVYLLVDGSGSMDWGYPKKLTLARQVAGAVGYLALSTYDRVMAGVLSGGGWNWLGPLRGRAAAHPLWHFLMRSGTGGAVDLGTALRQASNLRIAPGLTVLVSDCLGPVSWLEGLTPFLAAGSEVTLVQVLAPDETEPELEGDLRLVDKETADGREVSLSPRVLAEYQERLQEHLQGIGAWCARRGVGHVVLPSTTAIQDALLGPLAKSGPVRARG